jgi:hypothetical protein
MKRMPLPDYDQPWVDNWAKIQERAWKDEEFRSQLIANPRRTVADWQRENDKIGLPLIENLSLNINSDDRERYAYCALAPILAVPHPTDKWRQEWPGIVELIRSGDNAQRKVLVSNTSGFLAERGLELLKHVRYSINEQATAHVITMPLQRKDLPVLEELKKLLESEGLDPNGPYASSCCC